MTNPFNFFAGFLINFFILSLICGEAHGWGFYNYTEAIVYNEVFNESVEYAGGEWTDFCKSGDNYCMGIYCDENQYLTENWECVPSDIPIYINGLGYVFFHDDSPDYTITTKSQEYLKELKARVNRNDSSVYMRKVDIDMYQIYLQFYSRWRVAPYTFESYAMLFIVNVNSDIMLIDYHCSVVDIKLKSLEYGFLSNGLSSEQWYILGLVLMILSSFSLFIVAIFYACIRELRKTVIGKIVLVLVINKTIFFIIAEMHLSDLSTIAYLLNQFFINSSPFWFLVMAYETFVLLKY
jgi:hypothetical protein